VDFVFDSEDTNPQQVLLSPIGLQPPSRLRTIAQLAVESTLAEMPSQKERSRSQHVLRGRIISFGFIGVRHAYISSRNTLACVFGGTVFTFVGFYVGASKNIAAYISVDILIFVIFCGDWVTFSACVTEQACGSLAEKTECVVGKGDGGGWVG
jgi:hypothetical protein